MKNLLIVLALTLLPVVAFAGPSDVLLTSNGTLYTASVLQSVDHPKSHASSVTYISVTAATEDGTAKQYIVPATLSGWAHSEPALAFDAETGMLFVFWRYCPNPLTSELRFASLRADGTWSDSVSFDGAPYSFRFNLRVAATTRVAGEAEEEGLASEINVHATWWEETGTGERARYAMLTLEKGQVRQPIKVHDLMSFVEPRTEPYQVDAKFNPEILRHPSVVTSPSRDAVDVIFGDIEGKAFHRLQLKPVGDSRVRIPVGRRDREFPAPKHFTAQTEGRITAVAPVDDRLAFVFNSGSTVKYLVLRDEEWSSLRSIAVDDTVSSDTAIDAIRRMVSSY